MTSFLDIEQAAQRLRRNLRVAPRPDLRLLCALEFFRLFADETGDPVPQLAVLLETYLREFIPSLAIDARRCDPHEFFRDEAVRLGALIAWIEKAPPETVVPDDLAALHSLNATIAGAADSEGEAAPPPDSEQTVLLNGLFVEENPDLGLEPRGRLLQLRVAATPISGKVKDDDIVIRNPTARPDDPFRQQAQIAVVAARQYLAKRYGLSDKKRYRFDFEVLSVATALTGPSLGLPFAVGAFAALARTEVLRDRFTVPRTVAFSGALGVAGRLIPIDGIGLRRKIERAFHSSVGLLVIPRDHLSDAWEHVAQLETQHPGRKLDLVGADTLDAVANDPRLLLPRRLSLSLHIARKSWKAKRSAWVEVPGLIVLAGLLFGLVAPAKWMPWFDWNPAFAQFNLTANSLDVFNRDSVLVWAEMLLCQLAGDLPHTRKVRDLDGDGQNEVLFAPCTSQDCPERDWLFCFSWDRKLLFKRYCAIGGQYPGDTMGVLYDVEHINIVEDRGKPVIITEVGQSNPGRSHIRLWSAAGDSLGWYINAGGSMFAMCRDLDGDGSDDLLFLNYNNRMNCTALLVLKADSVYGCSPPYEDPDLDLSWVKRGNQLAYVLFPVSDLGRIDLNNAYNEPQGIFESESHMIDVRVRESSTSLQSCIIYRLDDHLHVVGVTFTDQFTKRWNELSRAGRLPSLNRDEYLSRVRDSVRYWTDSGWVSEGQLRVAESSHGLTK